MVRGYLITEPLIVSGLVARVFVIDVITRLLRQQIFRSHALEGTSIDYRSERTVRP